MAYIRANDLRRDREEDAESLIRAESGAEHEEDDIESINTQEAELESLIQTVPRRADEPIPHIYA